MLVVCNGAQKGGSTGVYQLAKNLMPLKNIPAKYQEKGYRSSYLALDQIPVFVEEVDWDSVDYVCKQHWVRRMLPRNLANHPQARFVNIVRDIRDVLVSRYYHDMRHKNVEQMSFADYYTDCGHEMMDHYCGYHFYWHRDADPNDVEPLLLSYEGLKDNFKSETARLGRFLDLDPDILPYDAAYAATAIENIRGQGPHYRKGEVGDWANHFTPAIAETFEAQVTENGYLAFLATLAERGIMVPDDLLKGNWAAALR